MSIRSYWCKYSLIKHCYTGSVRTQKQADSVLHLFLIVQNEVEHETWKTTELPSQLELKWYIDQQIHQIISGFRIWFSLFYIIADKTYYLKSHLGLYEIVMAIFYNFLIFYRPNDWSISQKTTVAAPVTTCRITKYVTQRISFCYYHLYQQLIHHSVNPMTSYIHSF